MASATAKYVIRLEDKTKRAFKAIGRSLKSVTKSIFSLKTGFISAAGIAGIGFFMPAKYKKYLTIYYTIFLPIISFFLIYYLISGGSFGFQRSKILP